VLLVIPVVIEFETFRRVVFNTVGIYFRDDPFPGGIVSVESSVDASPDT